MYDPKGNGKDKAVREVSFEEAAPPAHLAGIVHRFVHLKTGQALAAPYRFHALPDACTYLVFDLSAPEVAGITQLRGASEEFDLGCAFHFLNVRLLPGVWRGAAEELAYGQVTAPYAGRLRLREMWARLAGMTFAEAQLALVEMLEGWVRQGLLAPEPVIHKILTHLDEIQSVGDMAALVDLSPRQLQRRLKAATGFAPHDFLKILRLQQTLAGGDIWSYADQSHFIHSFRQATGYTPGRYAKRFDV